MKEVKKYKDRTYPPIRTKEPEKKDKDYFLKNAESIYSTHVRGRSAWNYGDYSEISFLREFASGSQNEDRYKNFFVKLESPNLFQQGSTLDTGASMSPDAKRKGYMNVFWDILPIAPEIMDTLAGYYEKYEYEISADPIDYSSRKLIEDEKLNLWTIKQNLPFLKQMTAMAGLPMQEPEFLPESQEELELHEALGGFKPGFARAMEKLIVHTIDVSGWLPEIKKMMLRDAVTLNMFGCRDYYDPEDCKWKTRYVDPENLVMQYSKYPDHRDSEYGGEFIEVSISQLRQEFPDETDEFFEKIAFFYSGYAGNPVESEWSIYNVATDGGFAFDFYKVCVFDCEWIDNDSKKEVLKKNKYGKEISIEVTDKKKVWGEHKLRHTDKRMRFGCYWVVGTDCIYQYGRCFDVARPTKKEASLTFHFYLLPGKSIIKRLVPVLDDVQKLWLKYQNAVAWAVNDGFYVNYDAIQNITLGGEKNTEVQVFKRFLETGTGIFKETSAMGMRNSTTKPFEFHAGGFGGMFESIMKAFQWDMYLIEKITGLNPLALGAAPDPNAPVGTSQLSLNATSNTLRPIISGYMTIKQKMAESITRCIQLSIKYNQYAREAYAAVIGEFDVEMIRAAEKDSIQYGIRLTARPTDLEKQYLMQQLQVAQQADRDGRNGGISAVDAANVMSMINAGTPMKTVLHYMEMSRKKHMKEQARITEQNTQVQSKAIQDQVAQKAGLDEQTAARAHERAKELKQLDKDIAIGKTALQEGIRSDTAKSVADKTAEKDKEIADKKIAEKQAVPVE